VACSTTATPAADPGSEPDASTRGRDPVQQSGRDRIEVALIGADGSGLVAPFHALPGVLTFSAGARWSPDARHVVFEHVHQTSRSQDAEIDAVTLSIVLMSGADQRVRGITDPALFAATADWSPDGKLIVYSALPMARAEAPTCSRFDRGAAPRPG